MKITEKDYIKASRKASRELEIELHGKQCSLRHAKFKTKKQYNRQRDKKVGPNLGPFSFVIFW